MLRLKQNVNLEELEKYGIVKKSYSSYDGQISRIDMYGHGWDSIFCALRFKKKRRLLKFRRKLENDNSISLVLCNFVQSYDTDYSYERVQVFDVDLLYNLIQANLIEQY